MAYLKYPKEIMKNNTTKYKFTKKDLYSNPNLFRCPNCNRIMIKATSGRVKIGYVEKLVCVICYTERHYGLPIHNYD